jgi:hypothetical protein
MVEALTNLLWSQEAGVRVIQGAEQTPNGGVSSDAASNGVLEGLVSFRLEDLRSSVRRACWASIVYRASKELSIWFTELWYIWSDLTDVGGKISGFEIKSQEYHFNSERRRLMSSYIN